MLNWCQTFCLIWKPSKRISRFFSKWNDLCLWSSGWLFSLLVVLMVICMPVGPTENEKNCKVSKDAWSDQLVSIDIRTNAKWKYTKFDFHKRIYSYLEFFLWNTTVMTHLSIFVLIAILAFSRILILYVFINIKWIYLNGKLTIKWHNISIKHLIVN